MCEKSEKKGSFLKRKNVIISFQRYGIQAMGAMALGLFASLLIGTIIKTVAEQIYTPPVLFSAMLKLSGDELAAATAGLSGFGNFAWILYQIGNYATAVTGAAMAVAIGQSLQAPPLVLFSLAAVGQATNAMGGSGGPLAVFFCATIACEIGKLVSKETKIDILVTPAVTVITGCAIAMGVAPVFRIVCDALGTFIGIATNWQPFLMGMVVSAVVGIALTLPISSAAICAAIGISGGAVLAALNEGTVSYEIWNGLALAGGAATAGCCAHMLGFAILSYPDNGIGGFVAQGLGTSMLQIPNLMKKPILWIPPVITSLITGALSTCVFGLRNNGAAISSGMGTSGLVGPIGIMTGWTNLPAEYLAVESSSPASRWIALILICFVLPLVITWVIGRFFRAKGWIKPGDLKIDLG